MIELGVCLVLVWVIGEDIRRFRIRNWIVCVLAAAFFAANAGAMTTSLLLVHVLFALAGLALLFAAFMAGAIGGGDAKLLAAALLWVGPDGAFVFSLGLFAGALATFAAARLGCLPSRHKNGRTEVPYGPSIAAAWIGVIVLTLYLRTLQ